MKKILSQYLDCGTCRLYPDGERGSHRGAGGAAAGAAVTGDAGGAIVGGALGATAGALIGNANEPGQCYYRGRNGRRYIANC